MRAVVQRVTEAAVAVDGEIVGQIEVGLCVLVGVTHNDGPAQADRMAAKLARLRIFSDDDGKMNRSVRDANGKVLVVSQFTLYADTSGGNRPSFGQAARPEQAEPLIERMVGALLAEGVEVATGRFRADMAVRLVNDGPVTVTIDVD